MAWVTENIRFVLFGSAQAQNADVLWKDEVGTAFDSFSTMGPGWTSASGQLESDRLELQVQAQLGRIDLIITPGVGGTPNMLQPNRAISNPQDSLGNGSKYLSKLARTHIPNRIAIAVQRYHEAPDNAGVNAILQNKIPGLPVAPEASDISFQINVRKNSTAVKKAEINRFCKWFGARRMIVTFQPTAAPTGGPNSLLSGGTNTLGVIEAIDINTAPGPAPFQPAQLTKLLDEILEQHGEIEARGYAALS